MEQEPKLVPAPPARELGADQLRWRCDDGCFEFETTADLTESAEIIGQERAVDAIRLGLEIRSPGYNIFAAGLTGTGKTTTIKRILEEIDRDAAVPGDQCFVNNFKAPDRPIHLALEAGRGITFKREMGEFVESLKKDIPRVFDSPTFKERRQAILDRHAAVEQKVVGELNTQVEAAGFTLVRVEMGPVSHPQVFYMHDEEPILLEELPKKQPDLTDDQLAKLRQTQSELTAVLETTLKQTRDNSRQTRQVVRKLQRTHAAEVIDLYLQDLKDSYDSPKVACYLDEVKSDILDNLERFAGEEKEKADGEAFRIYDVNVLVDRTGATGAPIVVETTPAYKNLFGSIERLGEVGGPGRADFMTIKSCSLLEADGGYLVFSLNDAAHDPEVWPTLKRTLKNGSLTIQAQDSVWAQAGPALKPEPIPLDLKVVVVGDHGLYQMLHEVDEDFRKIFKIKAEFDSVMPRTEATLRKYASFICGLARKEGLVPFKRAAVAAIIEQAVRLTGRSDKISTRFSDVADIVRESSYWTARDGKTLVDEEHVDRAVGSRETRVSLVEEKIHEMFADGTVLMVTSGEQVGAVNGLTVLDAGDHAFGHPVRLTARTAMGRAGIINIEREVELSGKAHSKGVFILEGFLRSRYAQEKPLSVSASIAFEQSYSNIDGDSASSTEIYALLSSLSGVPVRQELAVTGSVNQLGEIQPIGGANEKIEGFFNLCKTHGLTGDQGVLIPHLNQTDLMLKKEVVEAVRAGQFHVYLARTIDEGIALLTGVAAGERGEDDQYPEGTINRLVDDRLYDLAEGLREFGEGPDGPGEDERDEE